MTPSDITALIEASQHIRVLYIEDDNDIQAQMVRALGRVFKTVTVASDAEEAWQLFEVSSFDLVISDIRLPGMSGLDLTKKIKQADPRITVIMLTAYELTDYYSESIRQGIDGYLLKPVNLNELYALLGECVTKINEAKAYRTHLKQMRCDTLTGLPNAIEMSERISRSDVDHLLVLDIARFRLINMHYGNNFANKLLVEARRHLDLQLYHSMELYRLHSDKFVILSKGINDEQLKEFCHQIRGYFSTTKMQVDEAELFINYKIGIAPMGDDGDTTLLNAQRALELSKTLNDSNHVFYTPNEKDILDEQARIDWLNYAVHLIEEDKIEPFYQPIVSIATGELDKYEVLARGVDGDKVIAPFHILEAVESIGMNTILTRLIINKAFQYFEGNPCNLSFNITESDLTEGYLVKFLEQKMDHYGFKAESITLEILENITLANRVDMIAEQIRELRNMGIKIAIDDFGVENSNLSRLMHLELDYIKLDGMYVRNIATQDKERQITECIANLAKSIDAKLIAEYVESEEILEVLRSCGVDFAQGYHIGKPMRHVS
jgi:EAL domain-containing protein (putative c-di-GMP-specific phosphodiesterase class I)/DNA-binding response OmpR family regulator